MRAVRFEAAYPNIRVIKRERANAIVYLLMNEGNDAVEPTVSFYDEKAPEIWDPETGTQIKAPIYSTHGEWGVHVPLKLNPYQTKVVVFAKDGASPAEVPHLIEGHDAIEVVSVEATSGTSFTAKVLVDSAVDDTLQGSFNNQRYTANLEASALPEAMRLAGDWELRFLDDSEEPRLVELGSWTDLRPTYSGTAGYTQRFNLSRKDLSAKRQWHIDLGTVNDVAQIEINGQKLEPMLWAPYVQDLTPYLKAGENELVVYVSNTLANKHGGSKPSGLIGPVSLNAKHDLKLKFKPVDGPGYQSVVLPTPAEDRVTEYVYREVGDAKLKMKLWYPKGWTPGDKKLPATVFIFGGGWYLGGTSQFNVLGPYLANRDMIVLAPEYRTHRDGVQPNICLEDAKSAMRYVYKHADELGIDSIRIAAGGISAGGHLAAATAFCEGFNAPGDDLDLEVKPSALVLFVPVIDNGPGGFRHVHVKDYWEGFSPLHNISKNPPPTIFITGDQDEYSPIETVHRYKAAMDKFGGRCELSRTRRGDACRATFCKISASKFSRNGPLLSEYWLSACPGPKPSSKCVATNGLRLPVTACITIYLNMIMST